jgi:cysteine desulfurase
LTQQLVDCLSKIKGAEFVGSFKQRLSNTVSFVVKGTDSIVLLGGLDIEGICASSGSACVAGSLEPSHVVAALGKPNSASALVRFSLGRESTSGEVNFVSLVLPPISLQFLVKTLLKLLRTPAFKLFSFFIFLNHLSSLYFPSMEP